MLGKLLYSKVLLKAAYCTLMVLYALFLACGNLCHHAFVPLVVFCLNFVTYGACACMLAVISGCPCAPVVLGVYGNIFCLCSGTCCTCISLYACLGMCCGCCDNACIPVVSRCFFGGSYACGAGCTCALMVIVVNLCPLTEYMSLLSNIFYIVLVTAVCTCVCCPALGYTCSFLLYCALFGILMLDIVYACADAACSAVMSIVLIGICVCMSSRTGICAGRACECMLCRVGIVICESVSRCFKVLAALCAEFVVLFCCFGVALLKYMYALCAYCSGLCCAGFALLKVRVKIKVARTVYSYADCLIAGFNTVFYLELERSDDTVVGNIG